MLKTLSEANLATYTPYEGARLTDAGQRLAMKVIRRHRLLELFLAETLTMSWDEVHEEAEHMEHAASERLIDRIDALPRLSRGRPARRPDPPRRRLAGRDRRDPAGAMPAAASSSASSGSWTRTRPSSATFRDAAWSCTPGNSWRTARRPARSSAGWVGERVALGFRPRPRCWFSVLPE